MALTQSILGERRLEGDVMNEVSIPPRAADVNHWSWLKNGISLSL